MRNSIRRRLLLVFMSLAIGPLLVVGAILAWRSFTSLQQQSLLLQQESAKRVNIQVAGFFQELERDMQFTIQTQDLEKLDQDHTDALSDLLAAQPAFDELHLLNNQGIERFGVSRLGLATTTEDLSQADEFTVPISTGQVYYGPIFYDETTSEPLMTIAIPVFNLRTGSIDGVFVSVARIKKVWDLIAGIDVSQGQSIYIVDADGKVVAHRNPSVVLRDTSFNVPEQSGIQLGLNGDRTVLAFDSISLGQQQFSVVSEQTITEALAPAINMVLVALALIVVMAGIAGMASLLSVRQIVRPIQALVKAAERIGAGDLTSQVPVTTNDEFGMLAATFNSMTTQLKNVFDTLEQRVADRTKALATSAEVSRRLSTLLNRRELAIEVVEQIKEAFGYYHAHIYLVEGDDLVMFGGTGDAGAAMLAEGHKIPAGRGLVGRAAETNQFVLVADTSQDPGWLPNPLLPETKSEAAIPISVGERVLGVLDVQHNVTNGLTQEDIDSLSSIANQVAIALQNAQMFTQAERERHQNELILSSSGEGIFGLDKEGNHTFVNQAAADMLGYSIEEMAGEHSHSMWHHTHADGTPFPGEECPIYFTLRDGATHEGEEYFIRKDGTGIDVNYSSRPILEEGRVTGAVISFTDITQAKREREAIAQRAQHEEALNRITQKIQSTATIEEAMQVTARELGHALGKHETLVALDPAALAGDGRKKVVNE